MSRTKGCTYECHTLMQMQTSSFISSLFSFSPLSSLLYPGWNDATPKVMNKRIKTLFHRLAEDWESDIEAHLEQPSSHFSPVYES
ncbi:hypothetical protein M378DRAFT_422685 [Amanita muscaria Koide BX008]|uniref:Uncharacterized protein n=1 Tax=Amanita muscaria (strain Koide BX008) TaxID=946122 RepID=A0A0C2WLF4_AMAMK|nr:hypothetical protein M378DRAFT_422685 [Amanita muscaria Koide BX008]